MVKGYFIEDGNKKLPPRKIPVISIDYGTDNPESLSDDAEIKVLSIEENWYTIKKKDLLPVADATVVGE